MDDATYGALALVLTLLGGAYTWWAFRRRGIAAGTRGLALTLLAPAAWLTGTLRLLARIVDAVGDWAVRLVFSPVVWAGVVLAGVSAVLFVLAGFVGRRTGPRSSTGAVRSGSSSQLKPAPAGAARGRAAVDDDLAEIEAILSKRGIT